MFREAANYQPRHEQHETDYRLSLSAGPDSVVVAHFNSSWAISSRSRAVGPGGCRAVHCDPRRSCAVAIGAPLIRATMVARSRMSTPGCPARSPVRCATDLRAGCRDCAWPLFSWGRRHQNAHPVRGKNHAPPPSAWAIPASRAAGVSLSSRGVTAPATRSSTDAVDFGTQTFEKLTFCSSTGGVSQIREFRRRRPPGAACAHPQTSFLLPSPHPWRSPISI